MALGDYAAQPTITGQIQIQVTFVCPNCATSNTTPQVTKPLTYGVDSMLYGAVTCTNCGKRMLIGLEASAFTIRVQQTS